MNDTSVIAVSPSTASRVIGIATIAISSGTRASADANTNASTPSAPTPATRVSLRNDGPALVLGCLLEHGAAGQHHVGAAHEPTVGRALRGLDHLRVDLGGAWVGLVLDLRMHDRVCRLSVVGDERVVTGRAVRGDPGAREGVGEPTLELAQVGANRGVVGADPARQLDDGDQGLHYPTRREPLLDLLVGRERLARGHAELVVELVGDTRGAEHARDREHDPEHGDRALVGEDEVGELSHGASLGWV